MKAERIEAVWVEEQHLLSVDDLDRRWGLSVAQLDDLIAQGVLEPAIAQAGTEAFKLEQLPVVRTACRLQAELELDTHAVGVVLELLQRVRTLEEELKSLRARLAGEGDSQEPTEAAVVSPAVTSPAVTSQDPS